MAKTNVNTAGNGTEGETGKKISLSVIIAIVAIIVILILIAVIVYQTNKKESKPEV